MTTLIEPISSDSRYGEVWLAFNTEHGYSAAKIIPTHSSPVEKSVPGWWWSEQNATNEIEILKLLDHENWWCLPKLMHIEPLTDYPESEYITKDLRKHAAPMTGTIVHAPLAMCTLHDMSFIAEDALLQILVALAVTQQLGILHGDVHSKNVLVYNNPLHLSLEFEQKDGVTFHINLSAMHKVVLNDYGFSKRRNISHRATLVDMLRDIKHLTLSLSKEMNKKLAPAIRYARRSIAGPKRTCVPAVMVLRYIAEHNLFESQTALLDFAEKRTFYAVL